LSGGARLAGERVATVLLIAVALLLGANSYVLVLRAPASDAGRLGTASSIPVVLPGQAAAEGTAVRPAHLDIPAIGVNADVVGLGLNPAGELEPPAAPSAVGWYAGGVAPGSAGAAVLVGHVDSKTGPAVFWRLRSLRAGDTVAVLDAAAQQHRFVVVKVEQYAKNAFPTALVYGPSARPALRLVTCGGSFDRTNGHYVDNVVVYADELPA